MRQRSSSVPFSFSSSSRRRSARSRVPSPLLRFSSQSCIAAWSSAEPFLASIASVTAAASDSRTDFVPSSMPRPYSALSSNREFAHAGPQPFWFFVYGMAGALAPQMEEQPVALEIIMRSPKSCVMSLAYGVSPQPAHAPENSKSGCSNCEPISVVFFIGTFLTATFVVSTP